jgi:hypothetical protein
MDLNCGRERLETRSLLCKSGSGIARGSRLLRRLERLRRRCPAPSDRTRTVLFFIPLRNEESSGAAFMLPGADVQAIRGCNQRRSLQTKLRPEGYINYCRMVAFNSKSQQPGCAQPSIHEPSLFRNEWRNLPPALSTNRMMLVPGAKESAILFDR